MDYSLIAIHNFFEYDPHVYKYKYYILPVSFKQNISFETFKMSFRFGNMKICLFIMNHMSHNNTYYKLCIEYFMEHDFDEINEYDKFDNNICNIKLLKYIIKTSILDNFNHQIYDIVKNCIKTGRLDLVKLCYDKWDVILGHDKWDINPYYNYYVELKIPFIFGYIDIIQWMYDLNPLRCKLQFDNIFMNINFLITNNSNRCSYSPHVPCSKSNTLPETYQRTIKYFVNICDDVELELFDDNNIQPLYTIKMISDEDKLWRKSLRCIWIKSCIELALN